MDKVLIVNSEVASSMYVLGPGTQIVLPEPGAVVSLTPSPAAVTNHIHLRDRETAEYFMAYITQWFGNQTVVYSFDADVSVDNYADLFSWSLQTFLAGGDATDYDLDPLVEGTTAYTVDGTVEHLNTSAKITVKGFHPKATIQVKINSGAYSDLAQETQSAALTLVDGVNTISIKVTSPDYTYDSAQKVYTLALTRAA